MGVTHIQVNIVKLLLLFEMSNSLRYTIYLQQYITMFSVLSLLPLVSFLKNINGIYNYWSLSWPLGMWIALFHGGFRYLSLTN